MLWNNDQQRNKSDEQEDIIANDHGFASISRRQSVKPIIAAVCGGAYGGGTEIILNCDIVIADTGAKFALPEVKRGVVAIQGGIPRLAQIAGHQHLNYFFWEESSTPLKLRRGLDCESVLHPSIHPSPRPELPTHTILATAESFDAACLLAWGGGWAYLARNLTKLYPYSVNRVVALSDVLPTALSVAQEIVANSPDAVQSSKQGLLLSQKLSVHESQLAHVKGRASTRVYKGDNIKVDC
ncbi:hypothetical protein H0H93_013473 [Arthromyces matolae]|nr:hypothetical protein H0H93_013473 [Arthromyces matolae]